MTARHPLSGATQAAPRMLADVLWEAANERLGLEESFAQQSDAPTHYLTCNCIAKVLRGDIGCWWDLPEEIVSFLRSLGCITTSPTGFNSLPQGEQRQGARYMWLLLAMHVAEDEGIRL